jgi:predicted permease
MGTLVVAFKAVAPLFLAIFAGIVFSRSKSASEDWVDILNKYALRIGLPALVIASLMRIEHGNENYVSLILVNSVYFVVCMLLAFPISRIFRLSKQVKQALFLILSYGNVAYLGIPVLRNAYGEAAVPVAGIISSVYIFWLLTLGITLIELNGENNFSFRQLIVHQFRNPLMMSVFSGLVIVFFNLKLPDVFTATIQLFASSVTAVVLFSLGIFLGLHQAGSLKDWSAALAWSVVIMLVLPFIFYLTVRNSGMETMQFKATILESAMPLGLTPYALAVQYKLETTLVARVVVLSTLLSMVVIPVWMVVLS